jgi:hypothetical protein
MLRALDDLVAPDTPRIIHAVAKAAQEGDMRAAEIILRRMWPEPKGRPLCFTLPALITPGDLAGAAGAIVSAVAQGELSPDEGSQIASLLDVQRRAIETTLFEQRLAAIEKQIAERTP